MEKNRISKEEAERICKEVYNVADFCRKVGWQPKGANYRTFYKYVIEYNLDTSHFTGQRTNIGNKNNNGLSQEDFFRKDKLIKSNDVIKKLIANNLKEYKCDCCGITEWNGKAIKLQLHHIDGNHFNNEINNLQLLCPNCHSQTDTYAGKKNKKGICTHKGHNKEYKHTCKNCGKHLHRETKSGLCIDCLHEQMRAQRLETPLVNGGENGRNPNGTMPC